MWMETYVMVRDDESGGYFGRADLSAAELVVQIRAQVPRHGGQTLQYRLRVRDQGPVEIPVNSVHACES